MHKNGQLRRFWKVLQGDLTTVTDRFSTALPKPDHSLSVYDNDDQPPGSLSCLVGSFFQPFTLNTS